MLISQYISKEKINNLVELAKPYVQVANNALAMPVQMVWNKLSLKKECVPEPVTAPLNFTLASIFMAVYVFSYTNAFVYYLVAIVYPILHNLYVFDLNQNEQVTNKQDLSNQLLKINEYWILLLSSILIESVFGPLLYFIPLYSYLKIGFFYALIRDDFYLADYLFWFLRGMFNDLNVKYQIGSYFQFLKLD